MKTINPKEVSTAEFHSYLLGAVAPRPIAFASTVDQAGNINLSPFSFFNAFGANPPTLVFSPARRVRGNTTKHTLENILEVKETVINVVNYDMVEQTSLASTEYEKGVNEFIKAGFTPLPSEKVRPPRVAESPVQFECAVKDVISLGREGGAGNLIICEVLLAHVREEVLNEQGKIDPTLMHLVGRMGGDWYCRTSLENMFEVAKPLRKKGIGVDQLPEAIKKSHILTGNDLGKLGNVEQIPSPKELEPVSVDEQKKRANPHEYAHQLLQSGNILAAWKVLLD
ncbi:flavin reductase family protein [Rapidithrix thailandica]|uniref:Flavin reductase family protein n=1 Tax=Rapidithrix thailandica TaxID=413964 RepID=A0AAW9S0H4_9BACT